MLSSWQTLICGHNSLVRVCVVYVIVRLCVCLTNQSSVTKIHHSSERNWNAGSKARYSDVIWYVLALILLQGYKKYVTTWKFRDDASLLLVGVLNVLRLIVLPLLSTTRLPLLFSYFLLFLPILLSLDPSCVCLRPPTPEPSATARRCRCRHAVAIGLELHFLQLIARNRHEGVHVHLLSTSHHPSVTHTRVRMWMHAVVMYTHAAHVHDTCTLRMHLCLWVFIWHLCVCKSVYMCVPLARFLAQDTGVTCCLCNHHHDES